MGIFASCLMDMDEIPTLQRLDYDMTIVRENPVPIIWLVGPPGCGRTTQSKLICDAYSYEQIRMTELLALEATKETDRGRVIREAMDNTDKTLPDTMVVDIIKEEMLKRANFAYGYVINGFPRTEKQAIMFVKEIGKVDVIIYLYSDTHSMVTRTMEKLEGGNAELIKNSILTYIKEVKKGTAKFSSKVEKILTHLPIEEVFEQVQEAINVRLNIQTNVVSNTKKSMLTDNELAPL